MDNQQLMQELLEQSAARHAHLCPRQVLGVRMGMKAGQLLGLNLPQRGKRLFTFVEIDGCTTDGIAVATGCWMGRRTMRIMDFGKVAATFVDMNDDRAIRIYPNPKARRDAARYAPNELDRWHTYLYAYQVMPDEVLLAVQQVTLSVSLDKLISHEEAKAECARCGEEIFNERELVIDGEVLCRACAGRAYYQIRGGNKNNTVRSW